jgi:hypothetical protein
MNIIWDFTTSTGSGQQPKCEQLWPSNMSFCPNHERLQEMFLGKALPIWYTSSGSGNLGENRSAFHPITRKLEIVFFIARLTHQAQPLLAPAYMPFLFSAVAS